MTKKTFCVIIKEMGIISLLKKFNYDLALIKEYLIVEYRLDSKSISRSINQIKKFLKQETNKKQDTSTNGINEILFALKKCNSESL